MTARTASRWPRVVLVAIHAPVIAVAVVFTVLGHRGDLSLGEVLLPAAIGGFVGSVQLRHSLAAARGVRPHGALWTMLALTLLVYVPLPFFGLNWGITQTAVLASALMLLSGRTRVAGVVAVLLAATAYAASVKWGSAALGQTVYDVGGAVLFDAVVGFALFGAARLVRVHDELDLTRTELAELAVGRERLRVSRDLHDLLGQSLSAVSLKGDLALRLLHTDPKAAQVEIGGLTGVARDALCDIRAITLEQHTISLRAELDRAIALLRAAGVMAEIDGPPGPLPTAVEEVLAWTIREGVTNVLRHSQAKSCWIRFDHRDGADVLDIINDGAEPGPGPGNGLSGLTGRARAISGRVCAERGEDGTFRLLVEIPRRTHDSRAGR